MPKYNVQTRNPARYKKVKEDQNKLLEALIGQAAAIRFCPYCDRKISVMYPGYHGPEINKCDNCGELIIFPAIKISRSISGK